MRPARDYYSEFKDWRQKQAGLPKGHPERHPAFQQDAMLPAETKVERFKHMSDSELSHAMGSVLPRLPQEFREKASALLKSYRPATRLHALNVLLYATEGENKDSLGEALTALENYQKNEDSLEHPDLPPLKMNNFMVFLIDRLGGPKR